MSDAGPIHFMNCRGPGQTEPERRIMLRCHDIAGIGYIRPVSNDAHGWGDGTIKLVDGEKLEISASHDEWRCLETAMARSEW